MVCPARSYGRLILSLLLLLVLCLASGCGSRKPPNVVLITLDTTRTDRLGSYGSELGLTPALDGLAEQGVVFDRAYASAPLTLPSHATILTGLNPPEHGLHVNAQGKLSPEIDTLSKTLKSAGYRTGAFIAAYVLNSKFGLDQGFEVYNDDLSGGVYSEIDVFRYRRGNAVADVAIEWLSDISSPFFCWVHFFDPHLPYDPHIAEFGERFVDTPYDGEVAFMDMQVARILRLLDDRGLTDNTLIVIASDHGEGLGDHGERDHGCFVYNTTMRTAFFLAWPKQLEAGRRIDDVVSLADVYPTVLDLLNLESPKGISGRSLRPALEGKHIDPWPCYGESDLGYIAHGWSPVRSITTRARKFIRTTRPELYDLEDDPKELVNLIDELPLDGEELDDELAQLESAMTRRAASGVELSAVEKAVLQSLGYAASLNRDQAMEDGQLPDAKDMLPFKINAVVDARQLARAGRYPEAVGMFKELSSQFPQDLEYKDHLGEVLDMAGRTDEAIALYESILLTDPKRAKVYNLLGLAFIRKGDFQKAVDNCRRAVALEPELTTAYSNLGVALKRMGRIEEAIASYNKALEIRPDYIEVRFNLGISLAEVGRIDEAQEQMLEVLRLDPKNARARAFLERAHLQTSSQ